MPWLWCDVEHEPEHVQGFLARLVLVLALVSLATACTTTSTTEYLPDASHDRLDLTGAREQLNLFLLPECPRLATEHKPPNADTRVMVHIAATGDVEKSWLRGTLGDARLDGIFGAVAAQMHFDPPKDAREHDAVMDMGYDCAPGTATATITIL